MYCNEEYGRADSCYIYLTHGTTVPYSHVIIANSGTASQCTASESSVCQIHNRFSCPMELPYPIDPLIHDSGTASVLQGESTVGQINDVASIGPWKVITIT